MNYNIKYEKILDNFSFIMKKHFESDQKYDWRIENQLRFLLIYEIINTLLHKQYPNFFTEYNTSKILDDEDLTIIQEFSVHDIDYSILYQDLLSLDLYYNNEG